jgi:hypothetical protein
MKYKSLLLAPVFLLVTGITELQAQETIPASGGDANGDGGSVSYTVGQLVYTSITGTENSMVQGVQQPYEISVIIGIDEGNVDYIEFNVYPNPVTDYLQLKVSEGRFENLSYQLYRSDGKLLQNKEIQSKETSVSMKDLTPGTYILKLAENRKAIKTFKIIKN